MASKTQSRTSPQVQESLPTYSVGIDIGGTFTDLVFWNDQTADFVTHKVLTNPAAPHLSALEGLASGLAEGCLSAAAINSLVHATTLASNALIERRGARTALITTRGFRDVLEIGHWKRPFLYDLFYQGPEPLVPRRWRYEVTERLAADGHELTPLAEVEVRLLAQELERQGIVAVAVSFLHSFRNPQHEKQVALLVREHAPGLFVSLSSEVAPEIREYERTSTTVANAYLQPLISRYLAELGQELAGMGFGGSFLVMLSSGGITTALEAARFPVRLVESGPAAGTLAAAFIGELVGAEQLLSLDMGGTTAKMCLIDSGAPLLAADMEVARVHRFKKGSGLPLKVPSVELVEIGAGGGSIAYVDQYGLLRVGPQSAEARPGPACYALGGQDPTVTDADLVLGYLDPSFFLGGRIRLSETEARRALSQRVCRPLHLDEASAAWGIYQVVNASMASAIQVYGAERGVDLRRHPLLAFGGAGPVHACAVAEQLGIGKVFVPFGAGLTSAFGLLVSPPAFDFARGHVGELRELDWRAIHENYDAMTSEGRSLLKNMGLSEADIRVVRTADMRYVGQSYEITVPLPPGDLLEPGYPERAAAAFNREYQRLYGQAHPDFVIEALVWRASVRGPRPGIRLAGLHRSRSAGRLRPPAPTRRSATGSSARTRKAYFPDRGGLLECSLLDRYGLEPGFTFSGPAIVQEVECTTLVRPGWEARVDDYLNLVLAKA